MKTKIIIPDNIFSKILFSELNRSDEFRLELTASSLISQKLAADENAIGLIPTMDILTFKDFYISSEIGISFNALLSNSYIHFKDGQETIEDIFLKGDVCSNEIILSKILFKEFYNVDIKPALAKDSESHQKDNLLIVGDENYEKDIFLNGLSFAEEVIELISAPYVNYALAGLSENVVKDFAQKNKTSLQNGHSEKYDDLLKGLSATFLDFISVNIQHVIFDLEEQDVEGISSLLQMPYYHGMIKDMIDIKFV
ncbi:MAG: hypothetical protein WAV89_11075 [Ignavibacteriaceae bacterium]